MPTSLTTSHTPHGGTPRSVDWSGASLRVPLVGDQSDEGYNLVVGVDAVGTPRVKRQRLASGEESIPPGQTSPDAREDAADANEDEDEDDADVEPPVTLKRPAAAPPKGGRHPTRSQRQVDRRDRAP